MAGHDIKSEPGTVPMTFAHMCVLSYHNRVHYGYYTATKQILINLISLTIARAYVSHD